MPLINIHLMQGKPVAFRRKVGEIVYRTMMATINVPPKDNFQIIIEHDREGLVYDPEYLEIPRTDGIVVIQITLNEGRTTQLRKEFYKRVADVFISLVEVKKENWSFGNGIA